MIFYAVFIISSDGRIIIEETFQSDDKMPSDIISKGAYTTYEQVVGIDLQNKIEYQIEKDGITYNVHNFGDFTIILVSDTIDKPGDLLKIMGYKFLRQFRHIDLINWSDFRDEFTSFKETIQEVLNKHTGVTSLSKGKSLKKLTTIDILELPNELQEVAMVMNYLKSATLDQITAELGQEREIVKANLDQLCQNQYLLKERKNSNLIYSTARATILTDK